MHFTGRRPLVILSALAVALTGLTAGGPAPAASADRAPERVFVRLDGQSALQAVERGQIDTRGGVGAAALEKVRERRAALGTQQKRFVSAVEDAGIDADVRRRVTGLVNGVALTVARGDTERLARLPGVAAVVPDTRLRVHTDVSVPLVGAPEVWKRKDPGGTDARGDGMTVAVVDSGVDYGHPDLGGGFGPDHKVVAGYDFVNDDGDPMDDNGHGTHVAGIIAGHTGEADGITGVAPNARLTAYKVMNAAGSGEMSDIIAGLDAAVDPANPYRADVVNLSLGGPGDGTDPLGLAASAAVELGVVVVASAGNSGPGAQTVGSPASAQGVLSVGASVSGVSLPTAHMTSPRKELLQAYRAPFSATAPEEPLTGRLVDVGAGAAADYDRIGDVSGRIVAYRAAIPSDITRVSPALLAQARLAEERGAVAALAYNQTAGPAASAVAPQTGDGDRGVPGVPGALQSGDGFRMDHLVVLGLSDLQWPELSAELAGGPVEVSVSGEDVTDRVAAFSSRGPASGDFSLEPDLVAPGFEIRSTWPKRQWAAGIFRLSGTSMAAPHAAGAAALLRQLHPQASADEIRSLLVGSASPAEDAPVTAQGAGRLDVDAAARAVVSASPSDLSLGLADLSHHTVSDSGRVTLHNDAGEPVTLTLQAHPAGPDAGKASVSPSRVTIPAGGSSAVTVRVSGEAGTDKDRDLAGWIVADPGQPGAPDLRVPYLLAVRPLVVQTSPDPSDGTSSAFVFSPVPPAAPPVLTVTGPHGAPTQVTTRHDHGTWYRAELEGDRGPGAYRVEARADGGGGLHLAGASAFEVLAQDNHPGGRRWEPIGPNGSAGAIATTAADPSAAVVTQSRVLGPFVTGDMGRSFKQLGRLPVAAGTGTTVVDARDPDRYWYAVNGSTGGLIDTTLDPTYRGRLLRTADGGDHWQRLDVPDVHIDALVSDPDTRVLVAVTPGALLLSHDGGDHWSERPNPLGEPLTAAAIGGGDLYLASPSEVWVVRDVVAGDGGDTAERVLDTASDLTVGLVADQDIVGVLTNGDRVLASRDGGGDWQELYRVPGGGSVGITMRAGTIAVYTYTAQQFLGRDHGTSWTPARQPVPGSVEIDFAPWGEDGSLLWASSSAGMFRTGADGSGPQRIGIQGGTVHDLAVAEGADGGPRLLAGTDSDVFRTGLPTGPVTSATAEWGLTGSEAHVGTRIGQLAVSPEDPRTVWKVRKDALSEFHVYRSTDGGATWTQRGRTAEVPLSLAVGPDDERVAVVFNSLKGNGLYVTRDGGSTWKKLFHDQPLTEVAADPSDPDRLWLGGPGGLYRSDDFGTSVTKVAEGPVGAVDVSADGRRIVVGGAGIRISTDAGRTFRAGATGSLPMKVADIAASPSDRNTLYAATTTFTANDLLKGGRGVLRSTDGGHTWQNISGGLQNLAVTSLATSADGRWLYAGTVNGGAHRLRTG